MVKKTKKSSLHEVAPIPTLRPISRMLAAFVDYLLVKVTFNSLAVASGVPYDYQYMIPLGFGLIYFVVGNSCVARGQTVGKLVFGLQTRSFSKTRSAQARAELGLNTRDSGLSQDGQPVDGFSLLTLSESTWRYLCQYGALIAIIELPETIYRALAFEASSWVLSVHVFLGAAFFLGSVVCWAVTPFHLAFHDLFANSIVVPRAMGGEFKVFTESRIGKGYIVLSAMCGLALGGFSFLLSVDTTPAVSQFSRYRYRFENTFPVRIGLKAFHGGKLTAGAVVLPDKGAVIDSWLASNLTKYAVEIGAINPSETTSVDWIFIPLLAPRSDQDPRRRFLVDARSLEVTELPVEDRS